MVRSTFPLPFFFFLLPCPCPRHFLLSFFLPSPLQRRSPPNTGASIPSSCCPPLLHLLLLLFHTTAAAAADGAATEADGGASAWLFSGDVWGFFRWQEKAWSLSINNPLVIPFNFFEFNSNFLIFHIVLLMSFC